MIAELLPDQNLSRGAEWIRLADWFRLVLGDVGDMDVTRLAGGQSNPTFRISTARGDFVVRRKPLGPLLPKAHMIEREFRVMRALSGAGVPVPEMIGLCNDPEVLGAPFFVMRYVPGRTFLDSRLPGMSAADRVCLFDDMNRVVAALHAIDPRKVGLADFGRSDDFLVRQLALWTRQYRQAETVSIAAMERLIEWLPSHVPQTSDTAIFHGDLRLDNMIVDPVAPRVQAVLDWELSTLGDPLADLAYNALIWHVPPDLFRGIRGADEPGLPAEADYLRRYCERTSRSGLPHWRFYLAFAFFRLSAIVQGIAKRAELGIANDPEAAQLGRRTQPIAEIGWEIASGSRAVET